MLQRAEPAAVFGMRRGTQQCKAPPNLQHAGGKWQSTAGTCLPPCRTAGGRPPTPHRRAPATPAGCASRCTRQRWAGPAAKSGLSGVLRALRSQLLMLYKPPSTSMPHTSHDTHARSLAPGPRPCSHSTCIAQKIPSCPPAVPARSSACPAASPRRLMRSHNNMSSVKNRTTDLSLQHTLLHAPPLGLIISKCHRGDASQQVAQARVLHQVLQLVACRNDGEVDECPFMTAGLAA